MKKIALLMALLLFVLPITANAATPRSVNISPGMKFEGTIAYCSVLVTANSTNDEIKVVVKLWKGDRCIATWNASGTGFVNFSESKAVNKGTEYTLTADVTINGEEQPTMSFSGKC